MFKLTGVICNPRNGKHKAVHIEAASSALAHQVLEGIKAQGLTAQFNATVTTGAGSVTYKIIVE